MTASPTDDLASGEHRIRELTKELSEAQEQQAATAELLQYQPPSVRAAKCVRRDRPERRATLAAEFAFVFRFDGKLLTFAASYGLIPKDVAALQTDFPRPAAEDLAIGRAILQCAVAQIPDVEADPAFRAPALAHANIGSVMAVPFLRDGHPIGGITVGHAQTGTGRFTESQIRLHLSFADQAVVAIENTRLFEAEQARTREVSLDPEVLWVLAHHQPMTCVRGWRGKNCPKPMRTRKSVLLLLHQYTFALSLRTPHRQLMYRGLLLIRQEDFSCAL